MKKVRLVWDAQPLSCTITDPQTQASREIRAHVDAGDLVITERTLFGRYGGAGWRPPAEWVVMSSKHFYVTPTDDGADIEDPGSSNGTYVNGERVSPEKTAGSRPLAHGDVITATGITFRVELVDDDEPPPEGPTSIAHTLIQ